MKPTFAQTFKHMMRSQFEILVVVGVMLFTLSWIL
jgi:hypothetical protein